MRKFFYFLLFFSLFFNSVAEAKKYDRVQKKKKKPVVMQRTFAMIKPSGLKNEKQIKSIMSQYGLIVLKSKKIRLTPKQIDRLYAMHKNKQFYGDLKSSLVNKDVEVLVLYGDHAVDRYRMAVKDIRSKYALNKTENAVHGSDSWELAHKEICIFFTCGK